MENNPVWASVQCAQDIQPESKYGLNLQFGRNAFEYFLRDVSNLSFCHTYIGVDIEDVNSGLRHSGSLKAGTISGAVAGFDRVARFESAAVMLVQAMEIQNCKGTVCFVVGRMLRISELKAAMNAFRSLMPADATVIFGAYNGDSVEADDLRVTVTAIVD